jgi:hypothetical protein
LTLTNVKASRNVQHGIIVNGCIPLIILLTVQNSMARRRMMTMSKEFAVGDKVVYISGRHSSGNNNPLQGTSYACEGEIGELSDKYGSVTSITVFWNNGHRNSYSAMDLQHTGGHGIPNPNLSFRIKKQKLRRRS